MNLTADVCPVEPGVVEIRGARFGQFLLVSTIIATCAVHGTLRSVLTALLFVDLAVKGFVSFKLGPLALLTRGILAVVKSTQGAPKAINVGPKRFAARVGLSFAIGMMVCDLLHISTGFYAVATAFGLAAFLDAATGLCIACIVYSKFRASR